jgi:cytochrome P450
MRLQPVADFLARLASRDLVLSGITIPKDAAVSLSIASACRDETAYEHPDVFDIDRPQKPVIGFGYGVHQCMGMHIARLEMECALDALLDLPGLRLDPSYPKPVIRGMQLRGPDHLKVLWNT